MADRRSMQIESGGVEVRDGITKEPEVAETVRPVVERRIETPAGVILYDASSIASAGAEIFSPEHWKKSDSLSIVTGGRGMTYFVDAPFGQAVLRHYHRGGMVAKFNRDQYLWLGENRNRAFHEFRLLAELHSRGLPVPRPLAVRYKRTGLLYRCDLMTARLPAADSMAERLTGAPLDSDTWVAIGQEIRRLHDNGVYHADLNAHNILLSDEGDVYFVDFDRGSLREPAPGWQRQNMRRLYRSLRKIDRARPDFNFSEVTWSDLDDAYSSGAS